MEDIDFLKELGFLGFVTRLKRVSDAMLHDGRRLYKHLGMDIEPNWFVIFKLLQKHKQLTVTEIADKIGFAHPSVISIVNKMVKNKYLTEKKSSKDSRKRLLSLTEKAESKMSEFENIWNAGTAGFKRMVADMNAMEFLDELESRVQQKGFKNRTLDELKEQRKIELFEFEEKYAGAFARLNYEWIEEYYEVEDHDREMLDNPVEYIIKPGGQIFFAAINGQIVGTVALIHEDKESFELAKMAVTRESRGYKLGDKLMKLCIEYTKNIGRKRIFLESNTKQIAAINLYKKFGFKEIPLDPNTPYKRANIRMELYV